jgi:iron-sulfur cluster repair protein YtfE (RIC family)
MAAGQNEERTIMDSIHHYLAGDHRACDEQYGWAESRVACGDWPGAATAFATFAWHLAQHMNQEERILFPAIDRASGQSLGATAVMRSEHEHMRSIMHAMAGAIEARDAAKFFELADGMRMLTHQHNLKEEGVLYPMAERLLGASAMAVLARMRAVGAPAGEAA